MISFTHYYKFEKLGVSPADLTDDQLSSIFGEDFDLSKADELRESLTSRLLGGSKEQLEKKRGELQAKKADATAAYLQAKKSLDAELDEIEKILNSRDSAVQKDYWANTTSVPRLRLAKESEDISEAVTIKSSNIGLMSLVDMLSTLGFELQRTTPLTFRTSNMNTVNLRALNNSTIARRLDQVASDVRKRMGTKPEPEEKEKAK